MLPAAWNGLGWGYYLLGDMENALEHMEKGLKMQSDMGYPVLLSQHYYSLGMLHCDLADLKKAQSFAEKALQLSQENDEGMLEGMARALLGRVMGKADISQGLKAERCILQGIAILDELKLKPMVSQGYLFLSELHTDMGQGEKAQEAMEKAQRLFQEMGI